MRKETRTKEFDNFIEKLPNDIDPYFIPIRDDKSPSIEKGESAKDSKYKLSISDARERIKSGRNVGMYLKDDLVVMDIDGPEKAMELLGDDIIKQSLTIKSRTGKPHIYWKRTNGIEGRDIPNVVELRTGWRYVLIPGSYAYDRTEFHKINQKNWGLYKVSNDSEIKELKLEDLPNELKPFEEKVTKKSDDTETHTNIHGWKVDVLRDRDKKLDALLEKALPTKNDCERCNYQSRSEADLATMNKLLYWEFDDEEIFGILRTYRRYDKTERDDYLQTTLSKAKERSFETISDNIEPACWEPDEGWLYRRDGTFNPPMLANNIMEDNHFVTVKNNGYTYFYNDGIYKENGRAKIEEMSQERLGTEARLNRVRETLHNVKRQTFVDQEDLGGPKNKIVCENGILNTETETLEGYNPDELYLSKIPVKYDPEADCPKIKEFISEVVKEEDVKLVQEMFGYCLWKDYPLAKAFMLIGNGANGKSTLLDVLRRFLGVDNYAAPTLQQILNSRFKKIELHGKLANINGDLSRNTLSDTGTFKMLTGGDPVSAERKGIDPIEFYNYAKLIFAANEFPKTSDKSEAFFRRWIIIDFPNIFPEGDEDTDPNIIEKLTTKEEMSGLLNWALEGLHRILNNKSFSMTSSRRETQGEWIRRTDSLRAFVDECIRTGDNIKISKKLFEKLYIKYCIRHDIKSQKRWNITKHLPDVEPLTEIYKPRINGKSIRAWRNIDIKREILKKGWVMDTITNMLNDNDIYDEHAYSSLCEKDDKTEIDDEEIVID